MSTNTAVVTLQENVRWKAESGSGHSVIIDGPVEAGGENAGFRPMELMLVALGGCMAYDMLMILTRMREDITGYELKANGERADDPPTVYTSVKLEHTITGHDVSEANVKRALSLAENKYCSASAMFSKTAKLTNSFRIVEAG
ncbi:MAG: OsmC family protein [Dehalococcoidales bacterium]|nr:OsmC family protein [Dehalococcoidales bacterium]